MNKNLLKKFFTIIKSPANRIVYILAGLKLKRLSAKCKTVEDNIKLASSYQYSLFKRLPPAITLSTLQKKAEIEEFCKFIKSLSLKVILEIGTANGGTLFLLSRFSHPNALLISVDLPVGPYIGDYDYNINSFYKTFTLKKQKMVLIKDDSHEPSTLKLLKKKLENKQIDLLFIDGDHSYEGVKKDFEMYGPLVKENGIIAFHDIVKVSPEIEINNEVNKFWNEIKEKFEYIEIVDDWNQGWAGIGIIRNK